jgi:plasmid maintenance system antidote protein VapI
MTPADLSAWKALMGLTNVSAAEALGVDRSSVARWLAGETPIPHAVALACAALAAGLGPWESPQNLPMKPAKAA